MKEAKLYRKDKRKEKIVCTACARYCRLSKNQVGFCGVRKNINGKLYLLVYGIVASAHIDPIEKKPVFHFMPGSKIFSIGTTGCNWACAYCCNFELSQRRKVEGRNMYPKKVVELALKYDCDGIAYTYNQPSIFIEFAHDIGVIARKKGLINIFVSNGYDTPEVVKYMKDFLDSITVDLKGNAEINFLRKYVKVLNPEPIFQTLLEIKNRTKIHIEITDLIVPKIGDDLKAAEKVCKWVYDNLGEETPIQFLRFFPNYKLSHLQPTPVRTLEKHYEIAKKIGLKYVYIGNVPGHRYENTFCPECGNLVIGRYGFQITEWNLDEDNKCKFCENPIPIIGKLNEDFDKIRFHPIPEFYY
jgi:pyruvate formate lyase activating enzyme